MARRKLGSARSLRAFGIGLLVSAWSPAFAQEPQPVGCKFSRPDPANVVYLLHRDNEAYRLFDRNCDGRLTEYENDRYRTYVYEKEELARRDEQRKREAGVPIESPVPKKKKETQDFATGIILRNSFQDISVLSSPFAVEKAQGASFSWLDNGDTDQRLWSTEGVVAWPLVFAPQKFTVPLTGPYLTALTFAPYVQFKRTEKAAEELTFGAAGEIAVGNLWETTHYFRLKGSVLTDFDLDEVRSWSVVAEYEPISEHYIATPFSIGPLPITAEIAPMLQLLYSAQAGDTNLPLYSENDHALRVGGSVRLSIAPMQIDAVPDILRRVNLIASYSHLYDTVSDRSYERFKAAMIYNLNEAGNVAVTASYEIGESEATGAHIDLAKVGLAAKF